jgi:uncharacterized protein YndB with AHSA1/START domain
MASTGDKALQEALQGDLDLVHTRVVRAPRGRVYGAFTDPESLPRWWGPAGFTCRTSHIELQPGGEWHVMLVGSDGTEYENVYRFVELVADERFVADHVTGHWFRLTASLEDAPGGTCVRWRQTFETRASRDEVAGYCVPGNEQNLDKLEAFLAVERA